MAGKLKSAAKFSLWLVSTWPVSKSNFTFLKLKRRRRKRKSRKRSIGGKETKEAKNL